MKIGDYIRQENTDSTALIFDNLKNGSFKAYVHDFRGRVIICSIKNWYPEPIVINKIDIPSKVLDKISRFKDVRDKLKSQN